MGKIVKDIRVELSVEERDKVAREIVEHVLREESLENQKRIVSGDLTSQIKTERKAKREKSKQLRDGFIYKGIDCSEAMDFERNIVVVTRDDTGENIDERAMRAEERQTAIDFPDAAQDAPVVNIDNAKKKKRLKDGGEEEAH
jgi:hypothetical protein